MEPLGVAASVIAIVQLTGVCLKLTSKFIGPSVHNSTRLSEINTILYGFNGTIKNLQTHLEIHEEDEARLETLGHLKEPLMRCGEALKLLNRRMQSNGFLAQYIMGSRFDKKLDDCLRVLKDAKDLLELGLQCDQRVLINAVEKYVRSIAEETRDIKATIAQSEQLLTSIDTGMKRSSEVFLTLHDEQSQSIAQVNKRIHLINSGVETQGIQARTQEQLKHHSDVLSWLSNIDTRSNYLDALQLKEPGTGQWLIEQELFQSWKDGPAQNVWLHGMPGAGKTFLSTTVIDHLERSSNSSVAYFYFDFKDSEKQTTETMMRSIASQIEKDLSFDRPSPAIERLYSDCHRSGTGRQPTLGEVMNLISALSVAAPKVYIVLDALDECQNREKLLKTIIALKKAATNVKFFVTSRRESDIIEVFTKDEFQGISLLDNAVKEDIGLYISSVLRNDTHLQRLPEDLKCHIQSTLMDGAKFRWVKCQIDTIRPLKRAKVIKEALKSLPKTLDETYERILLQLIGTGAEDNSVLLKRIFIFVIFAKHPMTIAELAQAVTIEIWGRGFDEDAAFLNPEDLLSLCHPLIAASPTTGLLGFVHYSVQEFLLSDRLSRAEGTIKMFALDVKSSHTEIAELCLSFLNYNDFSEPCTTYEEFADRREKYPFLDYAASFWPSHARVDGVEMNVSDLILKLFIPQKNPNLASMLQAGGNYDTYDKVDGIDFLCFRDSILGGNPWVKSYRMNSLAIASLLGFDSVLKGIVENGADINAPGTAFGNPLQSAVYSGHFTTVKILVNLGANVNYPSCGGYGTALMMAIHMGKQEIVDYFFELGADVTISGGHPHTALHVAASVGKIPTMRRLIENGADVNWGKDMWDSYDLHSTPLDMAMSFRQFEAAMFLITSGAFPCREPIFKWVNRLSSVLSEDEPMSKERATRLVQELSSLGYQIEIVEDEEDAERLWQETWDLWHPFSRRRGLRPIMFRARNETCIP